MVNVPDMAGEVKLPTVRRTSNVNNGGLIRGSCVSAVEAEAELIHIALQMNASAVVGSQ